MFATNTKIAKKKNWKNQISIAIENVELLISGCGDYCVCKEIFPSLSVRFKSQAFSCKNS